MRGVAAEGGAFENSTCNTRPEFSISLRARKVVPKGNGDLRRSSKTSLNDKVVEGMMIWQDSHGRIALPSTALSFNDVFDERLKSPFPNRFCCFNYVPPYCVD